LSRGHIILTTLFGYVITMFDSSGLGLSRKMSQIWCAFHFGEVNYVDLNIVIPPMSKQDKQLLS
jgi:hypothetical protein